MATHEMEVSQARQREMIEMIGNLGPTRLMNEAGTKWGEVDGPGAKWLEGIRDDFVERVTYHLDELHPAEFVTINLMIDEDERHELADSAVSVYTHDRWEVFTDLSLWTADLSDYGTDSQDMTELAGVAQYIAAERLINALTDMVRGFENVDNEEDD